MRRSRRIARRVARGTVGTVAAVLALVVLALGALQAEWTRDRLRLLIVGQANQYLDATLEIGQLGGSLLHGVELTDVRLSRNAETIVSIGRVSIDYSVRELFAAGTTIRRVELDRLRVAAAREPDGRWNVATLLRRAPDRPAGQGPGRPVRIEEILLRDASISVDEPVSLGAVRLPTRYEHLNASFDFAYQPNAWRMTFDALSMEGDAPRLSIQALSGSVAAGEDGWRFRDLHVVTPRSDFTVRGAIDRQASPTRLDFDVHADRFAFQEWGDIVRGLRNIAVSSAFEARLSGPAAALDTSVSLRSDGGDVDGDLVLNSTVPGWHGTGTATVKNLDLARWLNRPDQRSTITGSTRFDLDLDLGGRFPRGSFQFTAPRVSYLGYAAADLSARGTLTPDDVRIAGATARAYGVNLTLRNSRMALDRPFGFHFAGQARTIDLRRLPRNLPVPHVESTLAMDFEVDGRFVSPVLRGTGVFQESTFLGARIAAGATGFIDTGAQPFQYRGAGDVDGIDLHRFGEALEVGWLRDPRYAGTVSGSFHAEGQGSDLGTMSLQGGGRLTRASLFGGELLNADVSLSVADGSLEGGYNGEFRRIDPAVPFSDARYAAALTGNGQGRIAVRDLLVRSPALDDYTIEAALELRDSSIREFDGVSGRFAGELGQGSLTINQLDVSSAALELQASGTLELGSAQDSRVEYTITRGDLAALDPLLGRHLEGGFAATGVLSGPMHALTVAGGGTLANVSASGVTARGGTLEYDVTMPSEDPTLAAGRMEGRLSGISAAGREIPEVLALLQYDAGHVATSIDAALNDQVGLHLDATGMLDARQRVLHLETLALDAAPASLQLVPPAEPRIAWTDGEVRIDGLALGDPRDAESRVSIAGTWRPDGGSLLTVHAQRFSIDALTATSDGPPRWGGLLDVTAEIRGSNAQPTITADFAVTEGRARRLAYERLSGRVTYGTGRVGVDIRLDQAPGVWLTMAGEIPRAALERRASILEGDPGPSMRLDVRSSEIDLGLLEGLSDRVRDVRGRMLLDVAVLGTVDDPHFAGRVDVSGAAFQVVASGARYRNGRLALQLATDRVQVVGLHLEDEQAHPLDITGSLATHELRVEDLAVTIAARGFRLVRNEYGQIDVNADLTLRGEFESPRLQGRIAIAPSSISVDRILDRTLSQPYSTSERALPELDPLAVLNPWERMGLDVALSIPGTLRMTGENVQISGVPLGLGDFNLRAIGDVYLYKDPGQPLYVTGSLDSVSGTYSFQGRRFDLDPNSSINFRGDLFPELYVMVRREISGVEVRVTMSGTIREPELVLASTPPLEPSDVLSLIVFNTSANSLTPLQQQQLAVRAGTIAAGFIAAPMLGALERSLGIDTLEIEPGADVRGGPRVTIGSEIAPGLVARFSRQFGPGEYSEAIVEYYLSRVLSLRGRFSDAGTVTARSPFRRVERAGIDLLFFFSF